MTKIPETKLIDQGQSLLGEATRANLARRIANLQRFHPDAFHLVESPCRRQSFNEQRRGEPHLGFVVANMASARL